MIGNAHLDPVWLWQWQEGYHEAKATFQSALDRMNEDENFVFTCACACYYSWVEENAPEMFKQIQRRVAEGRWQLVGGMWIQPDCNAPCGESMVRQLLYSQRYFKEKFGKTVTCGYNVDTFGHNAMLPQLLKKAGITRYVWMRPGMHENPEIPEGVFVWIAPDGSDVIAYRIPNEYNRAQNVTGKMDDSLAIADRLGTSQMCFYGVGNHGGGPTIANLKEIAAYQKDASRGNEIIHSHPDAYFDEIEASGIDLPRWKEELQHHASACYSTNSISKQLMRKAESALTRAEKLGALSQQLTGHELKKDSMDLAWQNVMFDQFHDIMGGCSIRPAMEDAATTLQESISIAAREENAALQRLSWQVDTAQGNPLRVRSKEESFWMWSMNGQGTPVVAFNPHAFPADATVSLQVPVGRAADNDGNEIPCQTIRALRTNGTDTKSSIFRAEVPAMGYKLFWVFAQEESKAVSSSVSAQGTVLENSLIRAEFDALTGAMTSLLRKDTNQEYLAAPARPVLVDTEHADTWGHMVFKYDQPAGMFSNATVRILENGPVRAGIEVVTRFGASVLTQKYYLYEGRDQIEVDVKLHFHEGLRMLKLAFPTALTSPKALAEVEYGVIERPSNGEEEHCHRYSALTGDQGGLAIFSDSKPSYSADGSEIRLTCANSSIFADHYGQQTRDADCEYQDQGEQRFRYCIAPFAGAWQDAGLSRRAAVFCQTLPYVVETYHEGPLAPCCEGLKLEAENLEMGALKRAEDGKGWILRISETVGRAVETTIAAPLFGRTIPASFTPFELKTLYLPDDASAPVREVLLTELD